MDRETLELVTHVADLAGAILWGGVGRDADFFSELWEARIGGPASSWTESGWERAFHVEDRTRCTIAWHETLSHRTTTNIEARLQTATGEYRWHRVRFVMMGERWVGLAFDLAERVDDTPGQGLSSERSARADVIQAAELKDRLLAAVSHELRAPIAATLLWERLLREGDLDPDDKRRALDAIQKSAMAQSRLVNDLIDVARITTGKLAVQLEVTRIEKVLREALDAVQPAVATKHHELVVDIAPDLGHVDGDAVRLVQVAVILLDNAIKFTPSHGRITLTAHRDASEIVIEVTDNGCGIDRGYLARVFDVFSQFDPGSTRGETGLGLGLAVASELVELHGGTLTAFSEGIGTGARFELRLPVSRRRAVTPTPERGSDRPVDGISVLVVDDDARVLEALDLLLTRAGARVTCAPSVDDAWKVLERGGIDIVVSDVAMPLVDGYQLVQRMRETLAFSQLPAIALTAYATEGDARRAKAAGFDLHLSKPVRLPQLLAGISHLSRR